MRDLSQTKWEPTMSLNHAEATANSIPPFDERLGLSIAQFCAMSSLGKTFVYEEIKNGRLRIRKFGKRTIVLLEDARRYLAGESAVDKAA
jgi:hypothetical protein